MVEGLAWRSTQALTLDSIEAFSQIKNYVALAIYRALRLLDLIYLALLVNEALII